MTPRHRKMIICCYWIAGISVFSGAITGSKIAVIPFVYAVVCTFLIRWLDHKERENGPA